MITCTDSGARKLFVNDFMPLHRLRRSPQVTSPLGELGLVPVYPINRQESKFEHIRFLQIHFNGDLSNMNPIVGEPLDLVARLTSVAKQGRECFGLPDRRTIFLVVLLLFAVDPVARVPGSSLP